MKAAGIASILHRETIAVLVGSKTFERGEACFRDRRVLRVDIAGGELRGAVRPVEGGRADYVVRMWLREEGVAYECTCPIGVKRQFCKHAVAIALAHLEKERAEAAAGFAVLRQALMTVPHEPLVEGLVGLAHGDAALCASLKRLCLDILASADDN